MIKNSLFLLLILCIFYMPVYTATVEEDIVQLIYSWNMKEAEEAMQKAGKPSEFVSGLYEFYSGRYSEAYSHFQKTGSEYAHWTRLTEDLLAVADEFSEIENEYFIIRFTGKDEIIACYLADILEISAERLFKKFNWQPDRKIICEIYPDRESFQLASTLTDRHMKVSGAIGICKFNRIMIATPRIFKFGYAWADTVTHEFVHYMIGRVAGVNNVPLWLNEGLAKYLEVIWRKDSNVLDAADINYIIKARRNGDWVSLIKMRHGMPTLDTKEEVALAFAQVQSMVEYIDTEYGWESIRKLLVKMRDGSGSDAFKKVFGKSLKQLQDDWQQYIIRMDIEFMPGASGPSFVFSEDPANALSQWVSDTAVTDVRIAERFVERGRSDLAEKKYLQALEKDPGNAVILNMLGKVQNAVENADDAEKNFLLATVSNPSYAPPHLHLGEMYLDQKRFDDAERCLMDYVMLSPFNPVSHELLRDIYSSTGRDIDADRESKILEILSGF
ncbi:MAG: peptidase MA family metallohydrolase [Elusimicrobiota bacterium]